MLLTTRFSDAASMLNITIDCSAYKIYNEKALPIIELSNHICTYALGYYYYKCITDNRLFMCSENGNLQLGIEALINLSFEKSLFLGSLKTETISVGLGFSLFITKEH